jgi:hypothetical protein
VVNSAIETVQPRSHSGVCQDLPSRVRQAQWLGLTFGFSLIMVPPLIWGPAVACCSGRRVGILSADLGHFFVTQRGRQTSSSLI